MEELLDELCGHLGMTGVQSISIRAENCHLVIYPTRFLEGEDVANNLLSNADRYTYTTSYMTNQYLYTFRLMPTPIYV